MEHQIAAGPQAGGLLQSAVAEECNQDFLCAGKPQNFAKAQHLAAFLLLGTLPCPGLPQRQAQENQAGEHQLNQADDPVAHGPPGAAGQGSAHDIGANGGPHAPHAVEPAHMAAGEMEGHIVIEGSIHASGTQAIGHRPQAQHPELPADRKSEKGQSGHGHADGRHPTRPQAAGQPVAEQAGNDGTAGNNAENNAGIGNRHPKALVHRRPGRPQQGIRQA